ncbi:2-oxoacid:acceptor oxidoreductase subunit alpha [Thermodesulforhabdus norvegica]|uniref:2-oxoglutarate ferredoxin oxidoreductase subunit alpha n=1 Tax=Thermodesulforhabdus norvegica TaxID=39841 RepID=A0A1I4RD51_9BACT|nr:2-oxoacid:acceptor oxidoreductase subunit alpha [Thermodesulforhabdus norvegica]SFM49863.1 2-oxoglutarate ferredoxin oxidoreductase subunit alpha [Thermodesulforhabdus norvegica]
MALLDVNIAISGAAGEGIQTIGSVLARSISRLGYAVFSWQEYESRIRGGLNSYSIRITDRPINSPRMDCDILVALNGPAADKYRSWLRDGGILVGEGATDSPLAVPFSKTATERWGKPVYANSLALGVLWGMLGADLDVIAATVEKTFADKGNDIVARNLEALKTGYEMAEKSCKGICPWKLEKRSEEYYLINGQPAIALGAVRAGCRFMAAYPMTPSTGIITFLAQQEDRLEVLTEQAEDEIAAVNMVIGAQFAGCRAMTATSGGGFALMVEALSLSGMTETPLVVVLAQRPGPATGLPTRTAQGDLLFALHAGHGEFPRCVLAPADPVEAFRLTVTAFNLADRFQIPVIIMTDQFLADSQFSIKDFDPGEVGPEFFLADPENIGEYRRYAVTEDGVSPRLYPGQSSHLVGADSDEHDEWGHITENLAEVARPMMEKRMRKMKSLRKMVPQPLFYLLEDAETVFVCWGSVRNALLEAVDRLREEGKKVGCLHFPGVWPLPEISLPEGRRWIAVEQNMTSQFGRLFACEYGISMDAPILRYDGLPITAEWIVTNFRA